MTNIAILFGLYVFTAFYILRLANLHNRYHKKLCETKGRIPTDLEVVLDGKIDYDEFAGTILGVFRWIPGFQVFPLIILFICYVVTKLMYFVNSTEFIFYVCGKKIKFERLFKFFSFDD